MNFSAAQPFFKPVLYGTGYFFLCLLFGPFRLCVLTMCFIFPQIPINAFQIFLRFLLWILDWRVMPETLVALTSVNRGVFVFTHTSYVDFYLFGLIKLAYPE